MTDNTAKFYPGVSKKGLAFLGGYDFSPPVDWFMYPVSHVDLYHDPDRNGGSVVLYYGPLHHHRVEVSLALIEPGIQAMPLSPAIHRAAELVRGQGRGGLDD